MQSDLLLYTGAIALGALHAFEPGHGKSIIAAYMIGTRGRAIDGLVLGFIVTFTHTFSVVLLGILATILSQSFTDDQLHTWLGLFSSLLILGVGLWMLKERLHGSGGHTHFHFFCKKEAPGPDHHGHDHHHAGDHVHNHDHHAHDHHNHDHGHDHDHADHSHGHDHNHDHHEHGHDHHLDQSAVTGKDGKVNFWRLMMLGVSGGLVPCPPAIAALLAAIGAGRIAQGLTVTLFFSLGLGLVMMTIGVVLSQAGRLTKKISDNMGLARKLGIVSALIITALGCITLVHSLIEIMA